MQARWEQLLNKFVELNSRERILILLAIFAVSYQLADMLILERQFQKMEQLNRAMAQDNSAIVRVNTELNSLSSRVRNDPNITLRDRIRGARAEVGILQSRLQEVTGELISPRDMARFLEQLLVQEGQLSLLRLQTLDVQPLLDPGSDRSALRAPELVLHRHGFAIEFSGSYLATLRYLKLLESLPWRFFWDSVSYEVLDYPESVVRLELHTLSLSEDWIGV